MSVRLAYRALKVRVKWLFPAAKARRGIAIENRNKLWPIDISAEKDLILN
jgi:hypothetical protein